MRYSIRHIVYLILLLFYAAVLTQYSFADNTPDKNHSSLSVSSSVPADGQTTAIITITLNSATNTPVSGHKIVLSDSSNSGASIATISDTTDENGHAIFSIKSTLPQTDNLDVTDTTSNLKFYTLGTITFTEKGCDSAPPGGTPFLTSATKVGQTQITLRWNTAPNPVTHYFLSYGISPGQYVYGNPNIGEQGTTSYTVGALTPGKRYYFAIKAINGCTSGGFSNELSAVAGFTQPENPTATLIPSIAISSIVGGSPTTKLSESPIPTQCIISSELISPIPTPTQPPEDSTLKTAILLLVGAIAGAVIGYALGHRHKDTPSEPVNTF